MLRYSIFFIVMMLFPSVAFAEPQNISVSPHVTGDTVSFPAFVELEKPSLPKCSEKYTLEGEDNVRMDTLYEYSVKNNETQNIIPAYFVVSVGGETSEVTNSQMKFSYKFPKQGTAVLKVEPIEGTQTCSGDISKEIMVYKEMIAYFGSNIENVKKDTILSQFQEKSVLFQFVDLRDDFTKILLDNWRIIYASDILIFEHSDILGVLTELEKIKKMKEITMSQKDIYIISTYSRSFLSKILASILAHLNLDHVYAITVKDLQALFLQWSFMDDRSKTGGEEISYEKKDFSFTMNSFLEQLTYKGVSYQFLGFLLSLALLVVVFNFLKQVVGIFVFGMYYPIFLSIIFVQFGISFTFAFMAIAMLSISLVSLISRRIHLLSNAKKSVLIGVYIFLVLVILGLDAVLHTGIFTYSMFDSTTIVIILFAILFICHKLFEGVHIFSRAGLRDISQYVLLLVIGYFILDSRAIQYFLISYPDTILVLVILNLFIGRYLGLQVFEYFRFSPILRHLNEEE